MSVQDALNSFLDTTNDEAELSTEFLTCPEFESVPAIIKSYAVASGTSKSTNGEEEKPWFSVTLTWEIDSEEAREAVKRDTVTVRGQPPIFLAFKDGKLDKDNNQNLARYIKLFNIDITGLTTREVLECLKGQYANVKVTHRQMKNKNGYMLDEEGNIRVSAEVSAVGVA